MALCGSQNCGCAFASSASITVTGSGNAGDPLIFSGTVGDDPVVQTYTASTTWSKPSGLRYVQVEVQGAGGGGGGAQATTAAQMAFGSGGGAGGYARIIIVAGDLAGTESVVVGAGGAGGSGDASGTVGETSSFGSFASAAGGAGGNRRPASSAAFFYDSVGSGVGGGVATGGDVNVRGGGGSMGFMDPSTSTRVASGRGGNSVLGAGGGERGLSSAGNPGLVYGGGGGGATNGYSQVARAGGDGAAGVVIVTEYY